MMENPCGGNQLKGAMALNLIRALGVLLTQSYFNIFGKFYES